MLVASHGTSGTVKAIEICFPKSVRPRRLTHSMRNLSAKVPKDLWPEFKAQTGLAKQSSREKTANKISSNSRT